MSREDFELLLKQHDWFYYMSDDHRVYGRGEDSQDKIFEACKGNEELSRIFADYSETIWGNKDEFPYYDKKVYYKRALNGGKL